MLGVRRIQNFDGERVWQARIVKPDGEILNLGHFETSQEAMERYDLFACEFYPGVGPFNDPGHKHCRTLEEKYPEIDWSNNDRDYDPTRDESQD